MLKFRMAPRIARITLGLSLLGWVASVAGAPVAAAAGPVITSFNPTTAAPGDLVTIYGSGFGSTQPANGLYLSDAGQNWGQATNASTFVIDSWSDGEIVFTAPAPSGTGNQWRMRPGTTATFCVNVSGGCNMSGTPPSVTGPTAGFTNQNLPIDNTDNLADYYGATEHIGTAPDSDLYCTAHPFDRLDSNSTAGGNMFDADAASNSLAYPDAGTALTPGITYTDAGSGLSYIWPNAGTCHYDLLDTGASAQTLLMPPNSGEVAGTSTELGLIGLGAGGATSGTITFNYSDGTSDTGTVDFGDWCKATPSDQTLVVTAKRSDSTKCSIFQKILTPTAGKPIVSISVPATSQLSCTSLTTKDCLRIFSLALGLCSSTTCTPSNTQTFPNLLWNHPADITYGTPLSSTQLDATAGDVEGDVAGAFSYSANPSGTILPAGAEQSLTATFTPSDTTHWVSGTTVSTAITVLKAGQTINFGTLPDHTYGDAPFQVSATASSGLPVAFSASGACTSSGTNGATITITGAGSCSVTASQSGGSDYNAASSVPQTFSISPAVLTVTAGSQSMTYGGTVPSISFHYSGFVNDDNPSVVSGTPSCSTMATSGSAVGSYLTTCDVSGLTATNYTFSPQAGSISVNPAPLTVVAAGGSMIYGGTVPAVGYSYSGFVNGDGPSAVLGTPSCSTTATDSSPAGPYDTSCDISGLSASNYTIGETDGTMSVDKAALTATASSPSMTYGGSVPGVTAGYSGFVNSDGPGSLATKPSCSAPGVTSRSGANTYVTSCSGGISSNYSFTYVNGALIVGKAALTVTASSPFMTYGGSVPAVTPGYSGFVNGDSAGALSTAPACSAPGVTSSSSAGTYSTSCSGGAAANYSLSYAGGTLTVNPYSPVLAWSKPADIVYPTALSSTQLDATASGPFGTVAGTFAYDPPSGMVLNVGDGQSLSGTFTPADTQDFAGGGQIGTTINVKAHASSCSWAPPTAITYGAALSATQLDAHCDVSGTLLYTPAAGTVLHSGSGQTLSATFTPSDSSYSSTSVSTTIAVDKAVLTVTASSAGITYGGAVPAVGHTYTGFVNADGASVISGSPICATTATSKSAAGTYPTSCRVSTLAAADYSFKSVDGTLTVSKAPLRITPANHTVDYSDAQPAYTFIASGFVNGDTASSLSKQPSCATVQTIANGRGHITARPGTYTIACQGAAGANYTIVYGTGALTVLREDTTAVYKGATTLKHGTTVTLKAVLEADGLSSQPLAKQRVVLGIKGGKTCAATTNASGTAACKVKTPSKKGQAEVTIMFAGTTDYLVVTKTVNVKLS